MAGPLTGMFAAMAGNQPQATSLGPVEEMAYQRWKSTLPPRLQSENDYDLRGFYKQNPDFEVDAPDQHMTDEFKRSNHPTFSDESRYYNPATAAQGGHWQGDTFVPNTMLKKRIDESGDQMAPDPRLRGREFPPPYASPQDVSAFYRSDVNRSAPPVMPFREQTQAGPAPPLGRLEMAYRNQK